MAEDKVSADQRQVTRRSFHESFLVLFGIGSQCLRESGAGHFKLKASRDIVLIDWECVFTRAHGPCCSLEV